jgi:hypothetical protein
MNLVTLLGLVMLISSLLVGAVWGAIVIGTTAPVFLIPYFAAVGLVLVLFGEGLDGY